MKNLIGKTWGSLSNNERKELLSNSNFVDGITGENSKGGECIVDLTAELSVVGNLTVTEDLVEIGIPENATIYSPCA